MINRSRFNRDIKNNHKDIKIKQIYARIYIKSIKKIIIVSKDWLNRQIPWWKPEKWESVFETLRREIYKETSININKNHNPKLFGYYYIEENWVRYLQLRYHIDIEDIDIEKERLAMQEAELEMRKLQSHEDYMVSKLAFAKAINRLKIKQYSSFYTEQ